ncbi:hypothetical protein [Intrasporangium calvum]|uniref:hypothetical protein n=1 Tax=Intrasporangium calvum TaxID=53358 RepID=UPI00059B6C22|nr:hypothetical protein [Intrasporangium calvum]AXG12152.1 hypothetical protein DN585_00710 [Intrasporangium calvum]
MRRWLRAVLVLVGTLLIVTTAAYRYAYGTWWQAPERIPYCGRTYIAVTPHLSLADIRQRERQTSLPGDQPYAVVPIGKAPPIVGAEMLAAVTPVAQREKLGVPCAMGLYVKTGDDQYTSYGITGGP